MKYFFPLDANRVARHMGALKSNELPTDSPECIVTIQPPAVSPKVCSGEDCLRLFAESAVPTSLAPICLSGVD